MVFTNEFDIIINDILEFKKTNSDIICLPDLIELEHLYNALKYVPVDSDSIVQILIDKIKKKANITSISYDIYMEKFINILDQSIILYSKDYPTYKLIYPNEKNIKYISNIFYNIHNKYIDIEPDLVFALYNERINEITVEISKVNRNNIVYGKLQEGKTTKSILSLIMASTILNCPIIWISQNNKSHLDQIKLMIEDILNDCKIKLPINEILTTESDLFCRYVTNNKSSIFISIGNTKRLQNIYEDLSKLDKVRYIIAIDEADIYWISKNTSVSIYLKKIFDMACQRYLISATQLDMTIAFDNMIDKINIIKVNPRIGFKYKGINQITHRHIDLLTRDKSDIDDDNLNDICEIIRWIQDPLNNRRTQYMITNNIKNIILGIHSLRNDISTKICKFILHNIDNIATIEYNQKGANVNYIDIHDNEICTINFNNIRNAISFACEITDFIYITGGILFNRGINFISSDKRQHPTDLIYTLNKSNISIIEAQRVGRLFGIDKDDTIRMLHSNQKIYDNVFDIVDSNDQMISQIKENKDKFLHQILIDIHISERRSKSKLSSCGIENLFIQDLPKIKVDTVSIVIEKGFYMCIKYSDFVRKSNNKTMFENCINIIIENNWINKNIKKSHINNELMIKYDIYADKCLDNMNGTLWSTIQKNKSKYKTTNDITLCNCLLYWKEENNGDIMIRYNTNI